MFSCCIRLRPDRPEDACAGENENEDDGGCRGPGALLLVVVMLLSVLMLRMVRRLPLGVLRMLTVIQRRLQRDGGGGHGGGQ